MVQVLLRVSPGKFEKSKDANWPASQKALSFPDFGAVNAKVVMSCVSCHLSRHFSPMLAFFRSLSGRGLYGLASTLPSVARGNALLT